MSLTVPKTQDVSDTIVAQLSSSFGQSVPILPKSFIRVLAKVFAGVAILTPGPAYDLGNGQKAKLTIPILGI